MLVTLRLCKREISRSELQEGASSAAEHAEVTIEPSRQESDDGKKVTIINQVIKPARWTQRDILSYVVTYDKLGRLAAGMDTEQPRLVIDGLMPQDLDRLSDEEVDRIEKELAKKGRR
jgi:hypothetical protein